MITVIILGAGNIGTQLCKAFTNSKEVVLLGNYNRKGLPIEDCSVPVTNNLNELKKADVYIVTYNDQALLEASKTLVHLDGIIVHTSGATPLSIFSNFSNHGVLYPIQSIKKKIPIDFNEVPFVVEGNSKTVTKTLKLLAQDISNHVDVLDSQQRLQLHVAAVFANNFSNFMYSQAADICENSNIDFSLLLPLILNSTQNLKLADPRTLQTGPAIRNDQTTIETHLEILKDNKEKELYISTTKAIQEYYGKKL